MGRKMVVRCFETVLVLMLVALLLPSLNTAQQDPDDNAPALDSGGKTQHDVVAEVVARNADLVRLRTGKEGLPTRIAAVDDKLKKAEATLARITNEYEGVRKRVETVGMTDAVGLLLRRQRKALPAVDTYEDRIVQREDDLAAIQLKFLDVDDQIKEMSNIESVIQSKMADVKVNSAERATIEITLRTHLLMQKSYLEQLREDYEAYTNTLLNLDTTDREIVRVLAEYRDYIDERVLWIKSADVIGTADLTASGDAIAWLVSVDSWGTVWSGVVESAPRNAISFTIAILIALVFIGIQPFARVQTKKFLGTSSTTVDKSFWPTVKYFVWTVVVSSALPSGMWMTAWILSQSRGIGGLGTALISGLLVAAPVSLALSLCRQLTKQNAIGHVHFGWSRAACVSIQRHILWFAPVIATCAFLFGILSAANDEAHTNSLGRLVLLIGVLTASVFTHMMVRPNGPLVARSENSAKAGLGSKLRLVAYFFAMLVPISIGVLCCLGYVYTAGEFFLRYIDTGLLVVGAVVLNGLIWRSFELSNHRIALGIRKRKLRGSDDKSANALALEEVDLSVVRAQTRSLRRVVVTCAVGFGLFVVWLDVLPALGFLNQIELWRHSVEQADADGNMFTSLQPVTLGSALLAVVAAVLTVVVARTVPGFLETTILPRFKLSSGVRYAFKSISRYLIVSVGTVLVFHMLGIGWSSVQWLVAGFSVGLGFGLQEIFANFVSGLILLIERPIRVGDTVTVNGVTGVVRRINMRATTIEDWDMKELVVPNKSFITTEIVNWSLSSESLRIVIQVGVAYGSDTVLVEKTLLDIAKESPVVLTDPEPTVLFRAFGESSLDFDLRCFVAGIDMYRTVKHSLNLAIDARFRELGIEIAFPQRTLWVRDFEAPLKVEQVTSKPDAK